MVEVGLASLRQPRTLASPALLGSQARWAGVPGMLERCSRETKGSRRVCLGLSKVTTWRAVLSC
jgi:hypothetical protein